MEFYPEVNTASKLVFGVAEGTQCLLLNHSDELSLICTLIHFRSSTLQN